jgi:hypothetical protein
MKREMSENILNSFYQELNKISKIITEHEIKEKSKFWLFLSFLFLEKKEIYLKRKAF